MNPHKYLTAIQAATQIKNMRTKELGISRAQFYILAGREGVGVKIGSQTLYTQADINKINANRKADGRPKLSKGES